MLYGVLLYKNVSRETNPQIYKCTNIIQDTVKYGNEIWKLYENHRANCLQIIVLGIFAQTFEIIKKGQWKDNFELYAIQTVILILVRATKERQCTLYQTSNDMKIIEKIRLSQINLNRITEVMTGKDCRINNRKSEKIWGKSN